MKWLALLGSLSALAAAACHDDDKRRGTCVTTVRVETTRCIVNAPRSRCISSGSGTDVPFTEEDPAAGQVRCKASGYDQIEPQATSCDGGYTGTFDMKRGGTVPDDMIKSALNNACALEFSRAR